MFDVLVRMRVCLHYISLVCDGMRVCLFVCSAYACACACACLDVAVVEYFARERNIH